MNPTHLRLWGLAVSGIALVVLLGFALFGGSRAPESAQTFAPASVSEAPGVAADVSFVVRFAPGHPLARAQDYAEHGQMRRAEREAERVIRRDRALAGLCFDRFTLGGAEIVLMACEAPADAETFQRDWSQRLAAMRGVEYAEANVILQTEAER